MALHPGVDPLALCRIAWRTYGCGRPEGGSAAAMQFVRVPANQPERNWRRRINEMALAISATHHILRAELLAPYLFVGYYGWRMIGFAQACRRLEIVPPYYKF